MSKKISEEIRNYEEHLKKMKSNLPSELQEIVDFLLKAATLNMDDDFFAKIFNTENLDVEKYQWFNGQRYAKQENGYYRQSHKTFIHRDIWEFYNGKIPRGYLIHHKDFNPANNDISNLILLTYSEHKKLHTSETEPKKFICDYCGKEFESQYNTTKKHRFCSNRCKANWYYKNNRETRICAECGKKFDVYKNKKFQYCSRKCSYKAKTKDKDKNKEQTI